MERTEALYDIAQRIEDLARTYGRRADIAVTYDHMTPESLGEFTDFQRRYHRLIAGEEYFLVWETPDPDSVDPRALLYAVCVTGDSLLTAAGELMELVSRKF